MPSKGVQAYTYISGPGSLSIDLSVPKQSTTVTAQRQFRSENFEVDAAAIKFPLKLHGRFEFTARGGDDGKKELASAWVDVNPMTGDIASKSTMDNTLLETRSRVEKDVITCFGIYESGAGNAGLPNRHQFYATVTHNWSSWQGKVAPPGSEAEKKPFACLVLPCPHDVGMNSMDTMNAILANAGPAGAAILTNVAPAFQRGQESIGKVISGVSNLTVAKLAPDIIASLSITQKDTLSTMLAIGARYFEFRPAHCHTAILPHSPLPDKLYFQHGPIPGMAYDAFLADLVHFLVANPTEIAVVHVRWDGVPGECKRPDGAELKTYLDAALALSKGSVKAGNLEDLKRASIKDLRAQGKRLLYVVDVGVLSTYDDAANATVDGKSMLAAFERILNSKSQEGKNMTVAQCQATVSGIKDVIYYSVATAGVSTMALMSTKAMCGHLLLPWLRDNVVKRCKKDQLLVVMDDFVDGAGTDVAVELSRQRLA
ncbi:uncharacterized protein DNG_02209 [Cephalotrichum gorgonifer]|uniref:PLC-like phosphodiesterase n=1 Tax=Cephalotrichum gorgonifer TaxID=2041049 RepID=A0AAE8MUG1_9PEZI|nr:uncharacterized protein DNG_02209 [Cephalotrichum gorgonifer]